MNKIINYFIVGELTQDIETQRHAQLIVISAIVCAVTELFYAGVFYKIGYFGISFITLGCVPVFLALPFVLKLTGSVLISGNLLMILGAFTITADVYVSGALFSVVNTWFSGIPLVAALLLGRKGALIWGGITGSIMICILLLHNSGHAFPEPLALTGVFRELYEFGLQFGIMLFITVCCFYYESVLKNAYRQVSQLAGKQAVTTAMRPAMKTMVTTAQTLENNSAAMSSLANDMVKQAQTMTQRSESTAAAAEQMSAGISSTATAVEEMSVTIQNISSTAEEMSLNVNAVSSSMEEMSAGTNNIAQDARQGRDISERAAESAEKAAVAINRLGQSAKEIDKITKLIKRIAEQTNLLALNATIEAASAGSAGKGFAVISKEIKELSVQTTHSSEKIEDQITAVQAQTENSVAQINEVAQIVRLMNRSSVSISGAVEQHHHAADEIAANIQQAGAGVNSIAANIAQIARGAEEMSANAGQTNLIAAQVASDIRAVSEAAGKTQAGYNKVNHSAAKLADVAQELERMADGFRDRYLPSDNAGETD
jgi:methyl-accepting chemotaxis protein